MTDKQANYLIKHNKYFYEGWVFGIEQAEKKIATDVMGFIDRATQSGLRERIRATESEPGIFPFSRVYYARFEYSRVRDILCTLMSFLEDKINPPTTIN